MSFWNSEKLLQLYNQSRFNLICPFDPSRVKYGSYELSFGAEAFITTESNKTKKELKLREQLCIPPGQFGLLLTEEVVTIPDYAIGFISIRASIKFKGLINVSGFHVDPGYIGRLKFAVYNAGSSNIIISRGDPVFLIWFADLDGATQNTYDNKVTSQYGITSEDVSRLQGEIASPAALKKQLEDLQNKFDKVRKEVAISRVMLIGLIVALMTVFLTQFYSLNNFTKVPIENHRTEVIQNVNRNESTFNNSNNNSAMIPSGKLNLSLER